MLIDSYPLPIFFPNVSVDHVRFFLPNVCKPNILSMKSIQTAGVESLQESYIYSVHVWDPLVRILQERLQRMTKSPRRNVLILGDIITPNTEKNLVQKAVPKISRRFQFSAEIVENIQWGWSLNSVRCLRNMTVGSWGKLVFRVSSHDNRLISFSNFFLHPSVYSVRFSCQIYTNLTLQRKVLSLSQRNPRKKDTFWLPSVSTLPRWFQSMSKYFMMNVLTTGVLVFSSISNTTRKQ